MDPNMAEANEWKGSQRPTLWYKDKNGVHSAPGRLPYYMPRLTFAEDAGRNA